jgi:hypothetical protein
VIQVKLFSFAAEGVAVNPQSLGGLRLVSVVLFEHALDKPLLEFAYSLGVLNSIFNHAVDESLKLVFHGNAPVRKFLLGLLEARTSSKDGIALSLPGGFPRRETSKTEGYLLMAFLSF